MVHGPRPNNIKGTIQWKEDIIKWWMDSITGNTPPKTDRAGHRFYSRFYSWYMQYGRTELTTVVKETDE